MVSGVKARGKVVLFFPAFASAEATAPLGLLAVATPLLRAGYEVCLIDSTITSGFRERVLAEVRDSLCLAISLVTGPMIRETVEVARAVKEWNPGFPVILGGWHPSLLPGQTLEADCVDIVIRGQGEVALLQVVERIESGASLDDVAGVGFKVDGEPLMNAERPLQPLSEMPPKAYQLADFDAYERLCGRRWAMYTSSLACPFDCAYCTNASVYGRQWNSLPALQVVEETCDLSTRYGLEMLWIVDDNFLVDLERALEIADGLIRNGAPFRWSIQATTNLTARLSASELRLLRRAGLQQICQGVDSASPRVLSLMNKTFQDFDSIYLSAGRCLEAGIRPSFNIIFAYPGERADDRRQTVAFIMDVCRRFPGAEFWTNIFTPYPGSPAMRQAQAEGVEMPASLEDWSDYFPRYTVLPWLDGKAHRRVQTMRDYLRLAFDRVPIARLHSSAPARTMHRALRYPARWRLDHDVYGIPLELWLNQRLKRFVSVAKPSVDARRLAPAAVADS